MQEAKKASTTPPRFVFNPEELHGDYTTSTLKDLLAEINREDQARAGSIPGKEIVLANLKRTLEFLGALTGSAYNSIVEPLPYSLLKTAKLLYLTSREGGDHIFEYLALPDPEANRPTFEFRLSGQASRNEAKMAAVLELLSQLERGIDQNRRNEITGFLLTPSKLLECIRIENDEILAPIRALPPELHANGTAAVARLSEHIGSAKVSLTPSTAPVNEALYIRILSLPFLHFVGEHRELEELAALDFQPQPDDSALRTLAQSLDGSDIEPYLTQVVSIEDYPEFFEKYATALIKLVSTITTLPVQKRDLAGKTDYVQKVLHLHLFNVHGRQPLDAKLLTLADVVAAMCTVAHQQKVNTPYEAYWQGKRSADGSKARNVFNQLENKLSIEELYEEDYVPQGVNRLLLNRLNQFHAYMLGYQDRYHALRTFEIARLAAYAQCLQLTDINESVRAVAELNEYSIRVARHWAHEASFA